MKKANDRHEVTVFQFRMKVKWQHQTIYSNISALTNKPLRLQTVGNITNKLTILP